MEMSVSGFWLWWCVFVCGTNFVWMLGVVAWLFCGVNFEYCGVDFGWREHWREFCVDFPGGGVNVAWICPGVA